MSHAATSTPLANPWPAADLFRTAQRWAVDSCAWTAATLAALPVATMYLLDLPFDARASVVIFLSGLFIYNLDHLADSYGEAGTATMWSRGIGRRALTTLVVGSLVGLLVALVLAPWKVAAVVVGYGVVGGLYGLPVLPAVRDGRAAWMRLKDIPGAKAAIVASSITLAAVGLPLAYAGLPLTVGMLPVVAFVWAFVFSNAVMCDVGDLRADLVSGVPTIPVLFGVVKTRAILLAMNVLVFSMLFIGASIGMMPLHVEAMFSLVLVVGYVLFLSERTPKSIMSLCLDGCSFVPPLLALLINGYPG